MKKSAGMAGQALVELAMVIPVLTLMFMGIYFIGRMNLVSQRCQMSARQGAWLKAHTNMSHQEIKAEMARFFSEDNGSIITEISTKEPGGAAGGIPVLGGVLGKMEGSYYASVLYEIRTPLFFSGVLPYSVPVSARCSMARGSWAGIGETVKNVFSNGEK